MSDHPNVANEAFVAKAKLRDTTWQDVETCGSCYIQPFPENAVKCIWPTEEGKGIAVAMICFESEI